MVVVSLPTSIAAKCAGLELWMDRVLDRADKIEPNWDENDIHDLRVALRRCRTMADALEEVNPASSWRKLKRASRALFRALGELRDVQIERSWVKKIGNPSDPFRKYIWKVLSHREKECRRVAKGELDRFETKAWRKWSKRLSSKARFFPLESVVFQRVALARLNEAADLYQKARKRKNSAAWHRLRIGVKNFRYVVENFLPQRYAVWLEDLKRIQDLLGDVHDLDMLRSMIRQNAGKFGPAAITPWLQKIDARRKALLSEFVSKTAGKNSPWPAWRAGFQWGHAMATARLPERRTA